MDKPMLMDFFRSRMGEYMFEMGYKSCRQFAMDKDLNVQRFSLYMKKNCDIVPGLDFMEQLKESCPDLNLNWIVTGIGIPYIKNT